MKHLEEVDFLKGYAIFTIVMFHLMLGQVNGIFGTAINFGGAGVHVFILCSGFGLYLSHMRKKLSYGQFMKRRILRVHLPFVLVVLLTVLIPWNKFSLGAFLSNIFFYKMFFENWNCAYGGQMWFVSMIVQMYLLFPILAKVLDRQASNGGGQVSILLCSLLISLTWATIVALLGKTQLRIWNSFCLQYLWEFVLGMWLALIYSKRDKIKKPSQKRLLLIAILGIAITGITGKVGGWLKLYNDIPSLLGYGCLALFIYGLGIKPLNKFFEYTCKFSYEWYLIHILIFGIVFHFMSKGLVASVIALVLSYVAAIGFHEIVKRLYKLKIWTR